jgi:hypothetical protein
LFRAATAAVLFQIRHGELRFRKVSPVQEDRAQAWILTGIDFAAGVLLFSA